MRNSTGAWNNRGAKRRRTAKQSRYVTDSLRSARRAAAEHDEHELDDDMRRCSCRCAHLYEAECDELCSPYGS